MKDAKGLKNKEWEAPTGGRIKVNCAGSFKQGQAEIGITCRNEEGKFLWGFGDKVKADSTVVTLILAVKKAIALIKELENVNADIEIDRAEVFWCLKKKSVEGMD